MANRQSTNKDHSQPRQHLESITIRRGLAALRVMIFTSVSSFGPAGATFEAILNSLASLTMQQQRLSLPAPMLGRMRTTLFARQRILHRAPYGWKNDQA